MQTTFKLFLSCLVCLALPLLNGCNNAPSTGEVSSVDGDSSTIVGKWEVDAEDKSVAQSRLEFLDDGTLIVDDNRAETGTWELENGKLLLTPHGGIGVIQLDYEISGQKLTLTGGQHGHTVRYNRQ